MPKTLTSHSGKAVILAGVALLIVGLGTMTYPLLLANSYDYSAMIHFGGAMALIGAVVFEIGRAME